MKILQVPIHQLKEAGYNPRKATKKEEKELTDSIKKFGIVDPFLVNSAAARKNIIIGGHFRLRVCKKLGIKSVPVVMISIPKIADEKELNLRLNKNTARFDDKLLMSFDPDLLDRIGFNMSALSRMVGMGNGDHPEIEFTEELREEHNYVVLYFDNEVDWLNLLSLYPLKSVYAKDSKPGFCKMGIGRVVRGVDFLEALKNPDRNKKKGRA